MNTNGHTRGSWTSEGSHPYLICEVGCRSCVMKDTPDSGGGPFYPAIAPEEHNANAHLIAAAPTAPHECDDPACPGNVNRKKLAAFDGLLGACKALDEWAANPPGKDTIITEMSVIVLAARAAIANARAINEGNKS